MPLSQSLARGATAMILSSLAFAVMGVCIQICAQTLPNGMVVFFRNLSGLVFLSPLLLSGGLAMLKTTHLKQHLFRGVAGLSSMYCFFYAIGHMPLADAILLNYTLPLFIPVVESIWLGEPFPLKLAAPLVLGFLGVVIVLAAGTRHHHRRRDPGTARGASFGGGADRRPPAHEDRAHGPHRDLLRDDGHQHFRTRPAVCLGDTRTRAVGGDRPARPFRHHRAAPHDQGLFVRSGFADRRLRLHRRHLRGAHGLAAPRPHAIARASSRAPRWSWPRAR